MKRWMQQLVKTGQLVSINDVDAAYKAYIKAEYLPYRMDTRSLMQVAVDVNAAISKKVK